MPELRLPLLGDVTQAINPWTWFLRLSEAQVGLVNINLGRSSDPELERHLRISAPMAGNSGNSGMPCAS